MAEAPPPPIRVDLGQLHDVTQQLKVNNDEGLKPDLSTANTRIQVGVRFGLKSPSGEAHAAKEALGATLVRHHENCERHIQVAESLVMALEHILTEYTDSDELAAAKIKAIEAQLDRALTIVNEAGRPVPRSGVQQ